MEFLHAFQASTGRSDRVLAAGRHRVIRPAIELPAGLAFSNTAPLLEEERDAGILTLVADTANPFSLHRPGPVAAFPADNHPGDSVEVDRAEVFEERLDGKEPDRRGGVPQVLEAREPVSAVCFNITAVMRSHLSCEVASASVRADVFSETALNIITCLEVDS